MKRPLAAFLATTSLAALIVFLAMWAAFRESLWPHWYYPVIFVFAADAMWKLSMLKAKDVRWHWLGLLAASGLAFALLYLGFGADLGFCTGMLLTYLLFRGFMIMTT